MSAAKSVIILNSCSKTQQGTSLTNSQSQLPFGKNYCLKNLCHLQVMKSDLEHAGCNGKFQEQTSPSSAAYLLHKFVLQVSLYLHAKRFSSD